MQATRGGFDHVYRYMYTHIMTREDYEAILETLDILSDDEAVEQLRRSIREVREGKSIPWEEAKARLGA